MDVAIYEAYKLHGIEAWKLFYDPHMKLEAIWKEVCQKFDINPKHFIPGVGHIDPK